MLKLINHYFEKIKAPIFILLVTFLTSCNSKEEELDDIKGYLEGAMKVIGQGNNIPEDKEYWGSELFKIFFDYFVDVFNTNLSFLMTSSLSLLGIGFALWLAFFSMVFVGALNNPNPLNYLNNVFKRGFVAMCIAIFLSNTEFFRWFLDNTAILVMEAFSAVSIDIVNSTLQQSSTTNSNFSPCPDVGGGLETIKEGFACVIAEGHKQLSFGIAFGRLILLLAENVGDKLMGLLIWLFYGVIDFVIPLFLMDGIFKFMVALILSPLFLIAFVFPSTKTYAKKGWTLVMGMCFQILFTVVFISFAIVSIREFAGEGLLSEFLDPEKYAQDDHMEILSNIVNGSEGYFDLMFASFFLLVMTDKMSALAKDFSGAPATAIVSSTVAKFGKLLIAGITAGVMIVATGGAAVGGQLKKMGGKALNAAKDTIQDGAK